MSSNSTYEEIQELAEEYLSEGYNQKAAYEMAEDEWRARNRERQIAAFVGSDYWRHFHDELATRMEQSTKELLDADNSMSMARLQGRVNALYELQSYLIQMYERYYKEDENEEV